MEEITIFDLLPICSAYLTKHDEESEKKFNEVKEGLVIKSFLPLHQKDAILEKTILGIKNINEEFYTYQAAIEISLTFNALLAYTNIDPDIPEAMKDYDFYDLLWGSGLCEYILQYCADDYKRLTDMVYHMLSSENLFVLIDELRNLDSKSLADLTAEFKRFRMDTNPESLIALGNIALKDDPLMTALKDSLVEGAVGSLKMERYNEKLAEEAKKEEEGK